MGTNIEKAQTASICMADFFCSEDGDSMFFQDDGTNISYYVVSYPRILQYEFA
jgi:hypothetical protein